MPRGTVLLPCFRLHFIQLHVGSWHCIQLRTHSGFGIAVTPCDIRISSVFPLSRCYARIYALKSWSWVVAALGITGRAMASANG